MTNCSVCSADNPDGKSFCGDCGSSLDPQTDSLSRKVESILATKFKDRNLIEYEVTDKVVTRFDTWSKIAVWMVAIPGLILTVVIALVGFFGLKTYSDASNAIEQAGKAAVSRLNDQERQIQDRLQKITSALADQENAAKSNELKLEEIRHQASSNPTASLSTLDKNLLNPSSGLGLIPLIPFNSLATGTKGEEVKSVQVRLQLLGCYAGAVNGLFDGPTGDAVLRFKKAYILSFGNPTDSTVDKATWDNIFSSTAQVVTATGCR